MPRSRKKKSVRAATLADVGRAAGVSAMAASVVLNGARSSSRIAAGTRARILAAAARLRYRPNAAARALAERRMHTIGVATVVDIGGALNHYFLEVFNGILEAATRHRQNTSVFTLSDWERDSARLPGLCDGRIDGLILIAPVLSPDAVRALPDHTPFVALHANVPIPGAVNLESDETNGAFEMVRHLISRGHHRILHLSGKRGLLGAERRIQGYKRALAAARIPFEPSLLVDAGYTVDEGRRAMHGWLDRSAGQTLPQAIFCSNDACGIGCLEALAEVGLRVPEDVSLAGFDDTLAARTTVPQLTTVRQPLHAMGSRAVEALLARVHHRHGQGAPTAQETIVFPTELVWRASVSTPAATPRLVPSA
ncbi:MAG TPA: LacI family DNA-binding transcriptional regulator [Opitutaceae bacterium]|nr:LacI family DNA-binding transcriptional regulator [Opitutaceae bacterium]